MSDDERKNEMGDAEALRFLVKLARPEQTLSRGATFDLIDGLRKYLGVEGKGGRIDRELRKAEKNPVVLAEAREVARKVVEAIADHKKERLRYQPGEYLIDASGIRPLAFEESSLRDAVLHVAAGDIDSEQAKRIRRCPRCEAVFYGQTNAKFCSRRCASAEAVSRYRAGKRKSVPARVKTAKENDS